MHGPKVYDLHSTFCVTCYYVQTLPDAQLSFETLQLSSIKFYLHYYEGWTQQFSKNQYLDGPPRNKDMAKDEIRTDSTLECERGKLFLIFYIDHKSPGKVYRTSMFGTKRNIMRLAWQSPDDFVTATNAWNSRRTYGQRV